MDLSRMRSVLAFGELLVALGCGGGNGGGNGTTEPPGPPAQIVKSNDNQSWYFSNPLPSPYTVTVRDASNRVVPDVPVTWAVASGGGELSSAQSVTNASGLASVAYTLGPSEATQTVTATVQGLAPVTFTATAETPPTNTAAAVSVESNPNRFNLSTVGLKVNGTVTWTWIPDAAVPEGHNVSRSSGPAPQEGNSGTQYTGRHNGTFTALGRFTYFCSLHAGMTGEVHIVQ